VYVFLLLPYFNQLMCSSVDEKYAAEVDFDPYVPTPPVYITKNSAIEQTMARIAEVDDGEGVWITRDNLDRVQLCGSDRPPAEEGNLSTVASITVDYAMQNVMMQMGLRLLALDGRSVRSMKRWILRCYAWYEVCVCLWPSF
jgi:RNA-binding protein NOB1